LLKRTALVAVALSAIVLTTGPFPLSLVERREGKERDKGEREREKRERDVYPKLGEGRKR
jgi:hypothetical protein